MNLVRADLPERLGAEYALGTLQGGARRRFEALLPSHPALRASVEGWERRLLPMALKSEVIVPRPALWSGIEARLGWQERAGATDAASPDSSSAVSALRRALRFWRAFGAVAALAVVVLAGVMRYAPVEAPMIIVLRATSGTDTLVAGLSSDRREVSIKPLQPVAIKPDRSLELWAVPKSGKPASLGLVSSQGLTALAKRAVPEDTKMLAVSVEPLGGSPTGQPTGPIVFAGDLTL
ncbi:MAG TPA: anti-sigma factor [Burkholderiaceae bacterium]|nr:anti-sigma factor [Burkholderiaceae bacterium]